jgi:hypothetical protein
VAEPYVVRILPRKYDDRFLQEEFSRIEAALRYLEVESLRLTPSHVEPFRKFEGDVYNADGTDWDPGSGAGLYQYLSGAWVKL